MKAQTAIGRSILVGAWHLLSDPTTDWIDLGPDHYTRHHNPDHVTHTHVKALETLGYTLPLTPTT